MAASPTARTLKRLREQGYVCTVVEKFLPHVQRKVDLFGLGDVLALHARDQHILLVQATSRAHVGDRLKRALGRQELGIWLQSGGRFAVWGWFKNAVGRWDVVQKAVSAADLRPIDLTHRAPRRQRRGQRQKSLFE